MTSVSTRAPQATFASVLRPPATHATARTTHTAVGEPERAAPDTLHDLALDQLVSRLAAASRTVDLTSLYSTPLRDPAAVRYRQAVFADLRHDAVRAAVGDLRDAVAAVERHETAARQAHYPFERELWYLHAAHAAVDAVTRLATLPGLLDEAGATSDALRGLAAHLARHAASAQFAALRDRVGRLVDGVAQIQVDVLVRGAKVTVAHYDGEEDLEREVLATFERFAQDRPGSHPRPALRDPGLDHVQAAILEDVARLYPDLFDELVELARDVPDVLDPVLRTAADELVFYTAYLDLLAPLESAGLATCLPELTDAKELVVRAGYDLAVARNLVAQHKPVVTNDLELAGPERILVISGPNQGGKTTTARAFGQVHHLAALGCPVPGHDVRLRLPDRVLTQFEREESLDSPEGRLGTDLARMHHLLDAATGDSVVVLNEVFSSTTLDDARFLTREILDRVVALDALGACVTFIDELSRLGPQTVSVVALVDPDDPTRRTLHVERRPADGRAYAVALAARYGLGYDELLRKVVAR